MEFQSLPVFPSFGDFLKQLNWEKRFFIVFSTQVSSGLHVTVLVALNKITTIKVIQHLVIFFPSNQKCDPLCILRTIKFNIKNQLQYPLLKHRIQTPSSHQAISMVKLAWHCSRIATVMGSNRTRVKCLWFFSQVSGKHWVYSTNTWAKTKMNILYPWCKFNNY